MQKSSSEVKARLTQAELRHVLSEACEKEEPVVFTPKGLRASFFCILAEVHEQEIVINSPIPPELATRVMKSQGFIVFCRSYKLEASQLTPRGTRLVFPIPTEAQLSQERSDQRQYFGKKDNTYLQIEHPYDKATLLQRKIFDLSKGGLSFRAKRITAFIQPGRLLPKMHVFLRGEKTMTRQGKIVYVTRIIEADGDKFYQVGVKFTDKKSKGDN